MPRSGKATAELDRIAQMRGKHAPWTQWGPYLSERQWGTVREDYSADGDAWGYFTHDMARSRAYRWGEDGLAGLCDDKQTLCFAIALWNGRDRILKERLFGLTNSEGNHGEDVKELYYYLDAVPSYAYMKMLYKYPQQPFPYEELVLENQHRSRTEPEYELIDTRLFENGRYFDVFIEYAKYTHDDIAARITIHNRGHETAEIHVLPHLWFRNTWAWGDPEEVPSLDLARDRSVEVKHAAMNGRRMYCDGNPQWLFCDNETNVQRLYDVPNKSPFPKDAIHDRVVRGCSNAVNPANTGTKCAAWRRLEIQGGASATVHVRLSPCAIANPFEDAGTVFDQRSAEADAYYLHLQEGLSDRDACLVQRQALAGMLWSKQYYEYDVARWIAGDPNPPPPPERIELGRNEDWEHLNNAGILSMPDKWEYPWYAAWDLAFHTLPLAMLDPEFAKHQLVMLTREWYMHPNGQLPAYEWNFSDVNPPVHAWATWRVFQMDRKHRGDKGDLEFLERVYHKLLLNFTWWVNRKDPMGHNVFQGGFLGLDNIGVFDRSRPLPTGGHIVQADGTSWMGMYCLNMMRIALELSLHNPVYQDVASKFFEHFLFIAYAMTNMGHEGVGLWDEEDEFYYDALHLPNGHTVPLKIRSMVGLIPLFAVETLEPELLEHAPEFTRRLEWCLTNRPELANLVSRWNEPGRGERRLLSLLRGHRMKCLLRRMLDPHEFLSDYGVRALSRHHHNDPYVFHVNGDTLQVRYQPGESDSGLFGGNSNWRGPIWFPVNYLLIESLQRFHHYYGDDFKIECPAGSGKYTTIFGAAEELSRRLARIFLRDSGGKRAVFGDYSLLQEDPHFRDYLFFSEYFHGENGKGLGALQQTGWTGLIAKLLQPRRDPVH